MEPIEALVGCEVRRLSFDYQVRLLLARGEGMRPAVSAELVIETPFDFVRADGGVERVEPGRVDTLASLLPLFTRRVESATTERQRLRLAFDDGSAFEVAPDGQYESWELAGRGVPQILVGPAATKD